MNLRAIRRRYYRRAVAAAWPMMPAGWTVLHSAPVVEWIGPREAFNADGSVRSHAAMTGLLRRGEVGKIDDAITLTLSQKLAAAGYTRRPSWRSLPKDFTDEECE